jgi:hypothetical protein
MFASIAICISCVACNHLVLSLRGLYYTDHIYFNNSNVALASDGEHDLHSNNTQAYRWEWRPADPFAASTLGSATLGEEERVPTMR